jgi:predicted ester cyclase
MGTAENKANQRRVFEEVIVKGNLSLVDELIAPSYIIHNPLAEAKGPEGFKQSVTMLRTAFPDIHYTLHDTFAEGDKVATRATMTGTFKGEMMGIPPTGKKVTITAILITRWAGGKEVEAWEAFDMLTFYQQLGISPPTG